MYYPIIENNAGVILLIEPQGIEMNYLIHHEHPNKPFNRTTRN